MGNRLRTSVAGGRSSIALAGVRLLGLSVPTRVTYTKALGFPAALPAEMTDMIKRVKFVSGRYIVRPLRFC